jgi:hypothetical protein
MPVNPQSVTASANANEPGGTLRQNRHIGRASGSAVFERQGCWRERSQQRTTEATEGLIPNPAPPDSPLQPVAGRSGWAGDLAIEARHYDAPERDVRGWMSHADNFGSTDRTDRHWTRPDEIQKSSRMGNGSQVRNAGAGSRRSPRAGTLCTLAGCVDHAGEKVRAFQLS